MNPVIFIADDNPADIDLFRLAFEEHQIVADFVIATDGKAAKTRLETCRPTLALIDINMPVADGFSVLAALRGDPRLRPIPAILVSSSTADRDRDRALREGATAYWIKPTRFNELLAKVATVLPLLKAP